ncbi:hypothetical protein DQ04_03121050 [Trypanosoma grayi]|uniref:hypothetical protein n=1 Tax=Trypanosoma grayi TaxID=71804 RepID=UPI0004F4A28D|nr:hypothetical protein DQ04_03121050 [Trypanosoma grayi]KEG10953.1 hypothetical protein DQ04_03121050 [Trypanosoma grayi]
MTDGAKPGTKDSAAGSGAAPSSLASPAADTITTLLLGVAVRATIQEDLDYAADVLRRAVARTTRVWTQNTALHDTSEKARMRAALVLDTVNRIEEASGTK